MDVLRKRFERDSIEQIHCYAQNANEELSRAAKDFLRDNDAVSAHKTRTERIYRKLNRQPSLLDTLVKISIPAGLLILVISYLN